MSSPKAPTAIDVGHHDPAQLLLGKLSEGQTDQTHVGDRLGADELLVEDHQAPRLSLSGVLIEGGLRETERDVGACHLGIVDLLSRRR